MSMSASENSLAVGNRAYKRHKVRLRGLPLAAEGRLRAVSCRDFNRRSEFSDSLYAGRGLFRFPGLLAAAIPQ